MDKHIFEKQRGFRRAWKLCNIVHMGEKYKGRNTKNIAFENNEKKKHHLSLDQVNSFQFYNYDNILFFQFCSFHVPLPSMQRKGIKLQLLNTEAEKKILIQHNVNQDERTEYYDKQWYFIFYIFTIPYVIHLIAFLRYVFRIRNLFTKTKIPFPDIILFSKYGLFRGIITQHVAEFPHYNKS